MRTVHVVYREIVGKRTWRSYTLPTRRDARVFAKYSSIMVGVLYTYIQKIGKHGEMRSWCWVKGDYVGTAADI